MSKTKQTTRTSLLLEVNNFIFTSPFFTALVDEEDVFESDFESTDEDTEVAQQTSDAGEQQVRTEERREKKVRFTYFPNLPNYHPIQAAHNRVARAAAAAHARLKVTFNPEIYDDAIEETSMVAKKKRRVSLGLAIDAETGEVINNAQRQSRRSHTILNTSATVLRMKKDAEDKKVCLQRYSPGEQSSERLVSLFPRN